MRARWRRAPWVLLGYPSVLAGLTVAALLAGLAASSAPFVTTAAASVALKHRLEELTSFASGVEFVSESQLDGAQSAADLAGENHAVERAADALRPGFGHVGAPVLTVETKPSQAPVELSGPGGLTQVVLMARSGALAHVRVLSQVAGPGVWISDITEHAAHLRPGAQVQVIGLQSPGRPQEQTVRVKGVYQALAHEPQTDYWTNFFAQIYPQGLDAPVPPSFVLMTPGQLDRVLAGAGTIVRESVEFPIDPRGITLDAGRALAARFDRLPARFPRSSLGQAMGCASGTFARQQCPVVSSLSAAVTLANENASAVNPPVTLLSALGSGIALAVAAAAGVFLVRRRRAEAALSFTRGEHVATFSALTALEAVVPMLVGGAAGVAVAYALTSVFAPAGSISNGTIWAAAGHAAVVVALALVLAVAAAAVSFLGLYDTGSRQLGRLRRLPWELPVAAAAVYLLVEILRGHGLTTKSGGASAPTLVVFVYPLLLIAAVAGLTARLARRAVGWAAARTTGASPPVFLALRRLAAAHGLVVVLAVVVAVSLGSLAYVETLERSLQQTTVEKAYMATGSDANALIQDGQLIPRGFGFPVTVVHFANEAAQLPDGTEVDVMIVDPATLAATLHWQSDFGPDPSRALAELAASRSSPLPVIVTRPLAGKRRLVISGVSEPLRQLAVVRAFPFMAQGVPLAITSDRALAAFEKRTGQYDPLGVIDTYAWAKGPPTAAGRALASLDPAFPPQTIDSFLHDPEVSLATRTYGYMRLIAVAAGLLALVGLVLYVQARQRSQAIASALSQRMGFGPRGQTVSLLIELASLLLFAGVVGGVVALAAAAPVVHRIDPLPVDPPAPIFVIPAGELGALLAALVVVAGIVSLFTTWRASRANVAEELRVV